MKQVITFLLVMILLGGACTFAGETNNEKPKVQLAILLDTSGSMSGLITQAKTQLWKIVNEFITAERSGKRPELKVALYEYGKNSIPASEGYIRMILPLTDDLDKVSEELFALKTNGSQEYCGQVIKAATESLAWSTGKDDLKVIVIAGNEPFTQGKIDYRTACKAAAAKGIIVNTIHCGSYAQGVSGKWQDGALLADGKYLHIDHNAKVVHIAAPQDKDIAKLGAEINKTYIPYGSSGKTGAANQVVQDRNASTVGSGSAVQRMVTKSSGYYNNAGWDLVDATRNKKVELEKLKEKDLPEKMQKMSLAERKAYVKTQAEARVKIQNKIKKLNDKRKKYVAKKRKELAKGGENTLDTVMIKAVREQAVSKNFKFK